MNELLISIGELLDRKLEPVLERMGTLENSMGTLKNSMDSLENQMVSLQNEVGLLHSEVGLLHNEVEALKYRVNSLESSVENMNMRLKCVEITLENETNPSIRIVAEGHLDLYRKLDEAMKSDHDREILAIKLNYLDSEMRRWKEQYPVTA